MRLRLSGKNFTKVFDKEAAYNITKNIATTMQQVR